MPGCGWPSQDSSIRCVFLYMLFVVTGKSILTTCVLGCLDLFFLSCLQVIRGDVAHQCSLAHLCLSMAAESNENECLNKSLMKTHPLNPQLH